MKMRVDGIARLGDFFGAFHQTAVQFGEFAAIGIIVGEGRAELGLLHKVE